MKKVLIHIISSVFLLALIVGCTADNVSSVDIINPPKKKVKSETKWILNNSTEAKVKILYSKGFDVSGYLVKLEEYNDIGLIDVGSTYSYSNNISFEEKKFYNLNGIVDSVQKNYYIYNLSGKIFKKIVCDLTGDTVVVSTFNYDEKGNLIKKTDYDPRKSQTTETSYQYTYNDLGNVVERLLNPGTNGTFELKDEFIYPSLGNNIEKRSYNSEGKVTVIYTYTYNSDGRVIKETQSGINGEILKKYLLEYTYH